MLENLISLSSSSSCLRQRFLLLLLLLSFFQWFLLFCRLLHFNLFFFFFFFFVTLSTRNGYHSRRWDPKSLLLEAAATQRPRSANYAQYTFSHDNPNRKAFHFLFLVPFHFHCFVSQQVNVWRARVFLVVSISETLCPNSVHNDELPRHRKSMRQYHLIVTLHQKQGLTECSNAYIRMKSLCGFLSLQQQWGGTNKHVSIAMSLISTSSRKVDSKNKEASNC